MTVVPVKTRRQLRQFIYYPRELYKSDPLWVPPLWREEKLTFHDKKNPILANSDFILCLAYKNGILAGRNLVYIDHTFNDFYKSKIGFFGSFECLNDINIARALMTFAESWLRNRGMTIIRGPIHPIAENWGFLYLGFDSSPIFMSPYNHPYYNEFMTHLAYPKVKDLLVYEANARQGYKIPERFLNFYHHFMKRNPQITLRRLNLKKIKKDAEHIWRLSNMAISNNWGYVPLDYQVLEDMLRRLKIIADVDAIWFVEDKGEPVAYSLGFPDLNIILKEIKGKLFPLGFIKILKKIKQVKNYRLFGLAVHPKYQNLGLDALLYVHLSKVLSPKQLRLEANYILEDNFKIKNALEKLNLKHIKTYRIYEKKIN